MIRASVIKIFSPILSVLLLLPFVVESVHAVQTDHTYNNHQDVNLHTPKTDCSVFHLKINHQSVAFSYFFAFYKPKELHLI
ncbi:MAG: hypothetical protein KDC69_01085, partial [Flavobacteriaceae bacterium]|nr:hypothetical protein [Flavobacteriaceae bacterium]